MNAIIKPETPSAGLVLGSFADAVRFAELMARARTVPKHLQDSPGDCLMIVEQAMRWGMSPFAVAQATSVISGKLMFEGKLVAAAVETSGAIVGQLDYEFTGKGKDRAVIVSGTRRGETNPRTVTVTLEDAKTNNQMWQRQPDQQLVYHGARVWARRWTPAVILGVYSREEMGTIIDAEAEPPQRSPAQDGYEEPPRIEPPSERREAINKDVPLRSVAAPTPRPPRVTALEDEKDWRPWLDRLRLELSLCVDRQAVQDIGGKEIVANAMKSAPEWVQREISAVFAEAMQRHQPPDEAELEMSLP